MRSIKSSLLISTYALLFLVSCGKKSTCFKGKGQDTSKNVTIDSNIKELVVDGDLVVVVSNDSIGSAILKGGENLIEHISFSEDNGVLTVKNNNKCKFLRGFKDKVKLTLPKYLLNKVSLYRDAAVTLDELSTAKFEVNLYGSGDLSGSITSAKLAVFQHAGVSNATLRGTVNELELYSASVGQYHMQNLESDICFINHSGTGNFKVWVANSLYVDFHNQGDVLYKGNPMTHIGSSNGTGQLNPL